MKYTYNTALQFEFRRTFKSIFYAWCYGSHKADLEYQDFELMYAMGNEL